jgi:hypothetical protein
LLYRKHLPSLHERGLKVLQRNRRAEYCSKRSTDFGASRLARHHICTAHDVLANLHYTTSVVCSLSLAIGCRCQLNLKVGIVFKSRYHLKSSARFEFGLYHPSWGHNQHQRPSKGYVSKPRKGSGLDTLSPSLLVCLGSGHTLVCLARSHQLWVFNADLAVRSCSAAHPISATEAWMRDEMLIMVWPDILVLSCPHKGLIFQTISEWRMQETIHDRRFGSGSP